MPTKKKGPARIAHKPIRRPLICNISDFTDWYWSAYPGDELMYHWGYLPCDRTKTWEEKLVKDPEGGLSNLVYWPVKARLPSYCLGYEVLDLLANLLWKWSNHGEIEGMGHDYEPAGMRRVELYQKRTNLFEYEYWVRKLITSDMVPLRRREIAHYRRVA